MKNALKSHKRRFILLICTFAVTFAGFAAFSHLFFHRSIMASLSEMYMLAVDRDEIYTAGNAYDDNLRTRAVTNLEDQIIPKNIKMDIPYTYRHEHNMQVYYFNEEQYKENGTVVLYIHGGGYLNPPLKYHWKLINNLASSTNCTIVMPIYLKVPNYTCEESYEAMVAFYKDLATRDGIERIVIAGDSSGGGMSLSLSQLMRDSHPELLQPEELILIAPWMDVSMENEEICEYEPVDPMLEVYGTKEIGKLWAGKRDVHDPLVSPIYGTFENLGNITIFIGTRDMLCPDCLKFSQVLNENGIEHTLVVEENLDHPYPLFPIPEAKKAQQIMIDIISKA